MKILVIVISVLFSLNIYGHRECLAEKKVSEECLRRVFEKREYRTFLKIFPTVDFENSDTGRVMEIEALYNLGKFTEVEKSINALRPQIRNTLYYRLMLKRSYVARRRYNQALELIENIKSEYPIYYINSELECVRADIAFFRRQYNNAVTLYDRCVRMGGNDIAHFNRLRAMERGGLPQNVFLNDYLDFTESFENSFLLPEVLEKIVFIRKNNNFPTTASPAYSRWLETMVKFSKLDMFFNEDFMKLPHPFSLHVISYLIGSNRFHDALTIIEDNLKLYEKNENNLYIYTVEKYRLLVRRGDIEDAADFMIRSADNFKGNRADRLKFFGAFYYFQAGMNEKAKEVFKELVLTENKGRYFLLALYRLGLIYIHEGSELYTFSLWSNYISEQRISAGNFIGGQRLVNTMFEMLSLIDRLNNFSFFSVDMDFECSQDNGVCGISGNNRFVSYYDFLYAHLIGREEFKNTFPEDIPSVIKKWDKNRLDESADVAEMVEQFKKLSKRSRGLEHITMLELFLKAGIKSGVSFYFDLMDSILRFDDSKVSPAVNEIGVMLPDKDSHNNIVLNIREFRRHFTRKMYLYLGRTADLVSLSFADIGEELTFSPHYGKTDEWKTLYPVPYFDEISRLSIEFSVPPQLIYSIMRAETFYRDNLVSRVGALGLMQVMPATFEKISKFGGIKIDNPFDPYESMKASAWYLSKLLARFDGNLILAVAAYNAGPHNVSEWLERFKGFDSYVFIELIPFYETRDYVKKVLRYFTIYSYLYEGRFYDLGLKAPLEVEENPGIVDF